MGLLQGACQNPGAPEDEEWGLQNPLAGFWFGRFAVLPLRSFAPRAKATPSHAIIDLELLAHPQSRIVSLQMGGWDLRLPGRHRAASLLE